MGYKYFFLDDTKLDEWKKVFEFCLKNSDFFSIHHLLKYENFDKTDRCLFI